jgi:hypothetical protein
MMGLCKDIVLPAGYFLESKWRIKERSKGFSIYTATIIAAG